MAGVWMNIAGRFDREPRRCRLNREGRRDRGAVRRRHEAHPRRRTCHFAGRGAGDGNGDGVTILVAVERDVGTVGELEIEDMHTWVESERGRELALAVVQVLGIGENDLTGWGEVGVDENVHVAGTLVDLAGRFDREPVRRHLDRKGRRDRGAVRRRHEAHPRRGTCHFALGVCCPCHPRLGGGDQCWGRRSLASLTPLSAGLRGDPYLLPHAQAASIRDRVIAAVSLGFDIRGLQDRWP